MAPVALAKSQSVRLVSYYYVDDLNKTLPQPHLSILCFQIQFLVFRCRTKTIVNLLGSTRRTPPPPSAESETVTSAQAPERLPRRICLWLRWGGGGGGEHKGSQQYHRLSCTICAFQHYMSVFGLLCTRRQQNNVLYVLYIAECSFYVGPSRTYTMPSCLRPG